MKYVILLLEIMMVFNKLFGPSIHLMILDMFLENPEEYMNVREIARQIEKNPGSVSRVLPRLVEEELLEQIQVGKGIFVYHLNTESKLVQTIIEFNKKLNKSNMLEA